MSGDDKTVIMTAGYRLPAGTRLNGVFEIDTLIGMGGMAEIYKGHNIQTQDSVAIKVILPQFAHDPQVADLFRREALILNRLSHEAIIRYHLYSRDEDHDLSYLAMEFVPGPTLRDAMKQRPLSQQEACQLISKVAKGMAAAHAEGVIHRDLSTDNIILADGNVRTPKVIDFGIARASEGNDATVLSSGFAGKYSFVAPEQLGLYGGRVGPASDVYSLGLVFAAALRGRSLDMAGSHAEVVTKRQTVPDLGTINPGVRPLLEAMLQPDPTQRIGTMAEVVDELAAFIERGEEKTDTKLRRGGTTVIRPTIEPERRRGPWGLITTIVILALLGGGAWYGLTQTEVGREQMARLMPTGSEQTNVPTSQLDPAPAAQTQTGKIEIKAGEPAAGTAQPQSGTETTVTAQQAPATSAPTQAPAVQPTTPAAPGALAPVTSQQSASGQTATAQSAIDETVPRTVAEPVSPQIESAAGISGATVSSQDTGSAQLAPTQTLTASPTVPGSATTSAAAPQTLTGTAAPGGTLTGTDTGTLVGQAPAAATSPSGEAVTGSAPQTAGEQQVALLQPQNPDALGGTAPSPPANGQITPAQWVENYAGSNCFFAHVLSSDSTQVSVEGFSSSIEPFQLMDQRFTSAFGFEAQIGVRLVTSAQCPVVEFIRDTDASPLTVTVIDDVLSSGEALQATVVGTTGPVTNLHMVTPDGYMINVTRAARQSGNAMILTVPYEALASAAGDTYLLLATDSSQPIAELQTLDAIEALTALDAVQSAQRAGTRVNASVKFLRKE